MTPDEYQRVCRDIASLRPGETFAIDTETTGLRLYQDDVIRGVSVAYRGRSVYIPFSHPDSPNVDPKAFSSALNGTHGLPVLHNRNFDTAALRQIGVRPFKTWEDTKVRSWLLDENGSHSLKDLCAEAFGTDAKEEQTYLKQLMKNPTKAATYKEFRAQLGDTKESAAETEARVDAYLASLPRKTWATLTYDDISAYAAKDTELTLKLYHHQMGHKEFQDIQPAIQRHYQVEDVVYRMCRTGVMVDPDRIEEVKSAYQLRMDRIKDQFEPGVLTSPQKLAKLLYDDMGLADLKGNRSTDKVALGMHDSNPAVALILEYRKLSKSVSTYLKPLAGLLDSENRLHTDLNTTGTVTGRFSSSRPNMQNIPRSDTDAGVSSIFVAPEGMELISYDMSQAELRIAASVSGDTALAEGLLSGDVYSVMADRIGVDRQTGKMTVLASNYWVGALSLATQIKAREGKLPTLCKFWEWLRDMDRETQTWDDNPYKPCKKCDTCETSKMLRTYKDEVSTLVTTMHVLKDYAESRRRVPIGEVGRFRRFPTEWQCRQRKLRAPWPKTYQAFNAVIQGSNAEILKSWLIHSEPLVNDFGARMVLTVHDSLVCEVPQGGAEALSSILEKSLSEVLPSSWMSIPLEFKYGI